MALARVVTFDGVDASRMEEMRGRMEGGEPPEGMPKSELLILHDADASQVTAIVIFDNEGDYAKGDEVLNSMPSSDTPGNRSSVKKYTVAMRMNS